LNKNAIEKLRKRFVLVAGLSFMLVMFLMGGVMYITNLITTRREIYAVLTYITQNDGDLPHHDAIGHDSAGYDPAGYSPSANNYQTITLQDIFGRGERIYGSPEFLYSTRYFAVLFDENMEVEDVKTNYIASVEAAEAQEYARIALHRLGSFGKEGIYYYKVAKRENGGTIVAYLDCDDQIIILSRLLYTALALIGVGSIATLMVVRAFSFRVIQSEIRNVEMQDRFMTNASHELKTPLAVIRANTEVEQMMNGENEWNRSTMRQVERMTGLIQNLVSISRAEEQEAGESAKEVDAAVIVRDTVDMFHAVAVQNGKELVMTGPEKLIFKYSEAFLRQLVSLLLDNAIKYCDESGKIEVSVEKKRKSLLLTVSNTFAEGEHADLNRFFERFYRQDESHNIEKEGYGVGLSIAQNIVEKNNGSIKADWKDGRIFFRCVLR